MKSKPVRDKAPADQGPVSTRLRKREARASENPAPKKRAKSKQAEKPSPRRQKKAPVIVQGNDSASTEDDEPLAARYSRKNTRPGANEASDKTHSSRQLDPVPSNQNVEPTEVDTSSQPATASTQSSVQPQHQSGDQTRRPTQDRSKKAVEADFNPGTRPPVGNMKSALPFLFTKSDR
jgi:hypothetical protein